MGIFSYSKVSSRLRAAAIVSMLAPGCTSLEVKKFDGTVASRSGIAYFLPFTQFESTITWVASCNKDKQNAFTITPKVEVISKTGPDPDGLHVIDYRSLSAFTKTSSVKVELYDSGAIKSINSAADDRSGEILSSTLAAIGKALAVGVGDGGDNRPSLICTSELTKSLNTIEEKRRETEGKSQALKSATDQLTAMGARMIREGSSVTDALRLQHSKQIGEVVALQMELDILMADLTEALKSATHVEKIDFPVHGSQWLTSEASKIPYRKITKWIAKNPELPNSPASKETDSQYEKRVRDLVAKAGVWSEICVHRAYANMSDKPGEMPTVGSSSRRHTSTRRRSGDVAPNVHPGIPYRIALPGELKFCSNAKCTKVAEGQINYCLVGENQIGSAGPGNASQQTTVAKSEPAEEQPEVIKIFPVKLLNRSATFYLPFESEAFTNGSLSASFSEGGVMLSAGYEQLRSQGEALASVGSVLASQVALIKEAEVKSDKTKIERLRESIDLAKARKELADAEAAELEGEPDPKASQITALQADTELKRAKLADREADIALIEAQLKMNELGSHQ